MGKEEPEIEGCKLESTSSKDTLSKGKSGTGGLTSECDSSYFVLELCS